MELYGNLEDVKALPGMLYGTESRTIISCPLEAEVEMGKAVFSTSGKFQGTGTTDKEFLGIAVFTQIAGPTGKNTYKKGDSANVATDGYVWCKTSANNPMFGTVVGIDPQTGLTKPVSEGGYAIGRFRSGKVNDLVLVELIPTAAK